MRYLRSLAAAAVAAYTLGACGEGTGPEPPPPTASITGTVQNASTSEPLPGATVSAGTRQTLSDAAGSFQLDSVPQGPAVIIRAQRRGYGAYAATIPVGEGSNAHDIRMLRDSLFQVSNAAVFIPPGVVTVRGVILYLAGGDTRAVATGVFNSPDSLLNEAQRQVRARYLSLALAQGLAFMGTVGLPDAAASDAKVAAALDTVAVSSDRPELDAAPLLINGASGGAPEGYGLALRQSGRVIGFMVIHGVGPSSVRSAAAQRVPGYVLLAEFDPSVNPAASTAFWERNRAEGALWSFAVEPGAAYHFGLSAPAWVVISGWINTVLGLRLPAAGTTLNPVEETSGWLGSRTSFTIAAYADYLENRLEASWFPSPQTAQAWQSFVTGTPE